MIVPLDTRRPESVPAPTFDTLAAFKRLQAAGFPDEQASALVFLLRDLLAGKPIEWPEPKP